MLWVEHLQALMRLVLRLPETTHADKTEAQAANTTDDELTPSQQALRSPRKSSQAWIMQKEKKLHCQAEDEFAALLRGVADPKKKTRADRNRQLRHLGQLRSVRLLFGFGRRFLCLSAVLTLHFFPPSDSNFAGSGEAGARNSPQRPRKAARAARRTRRRSESSRAERREEVGTPLSS